jgi:hypothetical protein
MSYRRYVAPDIELLDISSAEFRKHGHRKRTKTRSKARYDLRAGASPNLLSARVPTEG